MLTDIRYSCGIECNMDSLNPPTAPSPAFFADAMLGRLARWLRMLGYDTAYEKVISDESLIARVLTEQRWLLTRDRYIVQRKVLRGRHTLIVSDHLQDSSGNSSLSYTLSVTSAIKPPAVVRRATTSS
jgi:hypothetical protein